MLSQEYKTGRFTPADKKWMQKALDLAVKGAGYVSPNPLVGCIIVSDNGKILSKGYHERYGQPHAEINALGKIKDESLLSNATMYVTLEPCAHYGKTPPCADKIAGLPLKRVVVAMIDPNPKVSGKGIKRIKKGGITVDVGLMEEESRRLNEAFIHYMRFGKPYVIMKMAQTLDGYVAAPDGSSQWITGKEARKKVHYWRSIYDAVLIGRNTALNDNPRLTVRHVEGRQPWRIVLDGPFLLDRSLQLFTDQYEEKTIVLTHNKQGYQSYGDPMLSLLSPHSFKGKTLLIGKKDGHTDLNEAISEIGRLGITSVLVEPGSSLATALIKENLVDKLHVFIAPKILGGGTRSVIGAGLNSITQAIPLKNISHEQIGNDILISGYF
jgi:diaminohydroxyphosphoribosylaminopyrimidine deaminase/5-amino-6-(5-phosphoribosylamino)uracil reductase